MPLRRGTPLSRIGVGRVAATVGCVRLGTVNARSALFDLYGDHLRSRGGQAPIAALVRLLAPLGVSGPAVRTAVSRMVRQQWLEPARTGGGAAYAMTPRAWRRLDQAADRIYRTRDAGWDGRWHLVVLDRISERGARERVRSALGFLGYAPLAESTWLAAYASDEVEAVVTAEGGHARAFLGHHDEDPRRLARELWDLDALGAAYERWLAQASGMTAGVSEAADDQTAFAVRSRLVHEWRKFLFSDPGLPRQLLPARWPGEDAATFFDAEAARLLPAASRFVDSCLQLSAATNGAPP